MENTFVLYIDILGFGRMCLDLDGRVPKIYDVIFDMRLGGNKVYEITIFSDTVLVRNKGSLDDRSSVQFLIEFFQILEQRLAELEVYTRAVMTFDRFHSELRDDVYLAYGPAVVAAHKAEKDQKGLGLYLFASCANHNYFYDQLCLTEEKMYFVFTLNTFRSVASNSVNGVYLDTCRLEETDDFCLLPQQVRFLQQIDLIGTEHKCEEIRQKYLEYGNYYATKYPKLVAALRDSGFSLECINSEFDWTRYEEQR